ncbi:hypothetical protein NL348_27835, partial [Klebsiella pneumoniae]|nr:hypothetical protein [Klebsiella pneumoniae]
RTKVVERPVAERPAAEAAPGGRPDAGSTRDDDTGAGGEATYDASADSPMLVTTGSIPRIEVEVAKAPPPSVLDDDTAMLLIDFR